MAGESLYHAIIDGVAEGVAGSLEQIASAARRRAPVRQLFKGEARYKIRGKIGVHNEYTFSGAYRMAERVARLVAGSPSSGKYPIAGPGRRQGAQNSSIPSTQKIKALGNQRLIGHSSKNDYISFREVRQVGSGYEFMHDMVRARVGKKTQLLSIRDQFVSRAAYDLARGTGVHTNKATGEEEYGGTLRDSIHTNGPIREMGSGLVYGYVIASAKREGGFNYAYAQEFGTAHNRAQPFLRPALREEFQRVVNFQKMKVRERLRHARGATKPHVAATVHVTFDTTLDPRMANAIRSVNRNLNALGTRPQSRR